MNAKHNTTLNAAAMSHVRGGLILPVAVLLSECSVYAEGISRKQDQLQKQSHLT